MAEDQPMIALRQGDRISEYILEEPLGRGGFGEVWKARHHVWSDRVVAVKIPTSPEAVRQLANEGVIQASLDHPGIARTLGMDTAGETPYFVTEYVPGRNLQEVLREQGPFAPSRAREVLLQVLDVLEYAHQRGVIHQDIKPANLLITEAGRVVVTDFGLGQTTRGESLLLSASLRSRVDSVGGTVPYLAPEIRDGATDLDGRVDLYSLGIVLFELLTGHRPAGAELPTHLRPDLPGWCDEVFQGLYARRDRRFKDVATVRARLHAAPPAAPPRVVPVLPPRRRLLSRSEACVRLDLSPEELEVVVARGQLREVVIDGQSHLLEEEVAGFERTHPVHVSGPLTPPPLPGHRIAVPPRPDPNLARPAGLIVRGLAFALDVLLLLVAIESLTVLGLALPPLAPLARVGGAVAPLLLYLLYFTVGVGVFGRTVGKGLLGLRVVAADGSPIGLPEAFTRTLCYALSALPFGLGFLVAAFSEQKVTFHDGICGTRVVHTRPGAR